MIEAIKHIQKGEYRDPGGRRLAVNLSAMQCVSNTCLILADFGNTIISQITHWHCNWLNQWNNRRLFKGEVFMPIFKSTSHMIGVCLPKKAVRNNIFQVDTLSIQIGNWMYRWNLSVILIWFRVVWNQSKFRMKCWWKWFLRSTY